MNIITRKYIHGKQRINPKYICIHPQDNSCLFNILRRIQDADVMMIIINIFCNMTCLILLCFFFIKLFYIKTTVSSHLHHFAVAEENGWRWWSWSWLTDAVLAFASATTSVVTAAVQARWWRWWLYCIILPFATVYRVEKENLNNFLFICIIPHELHETLKMMKKETWRENKSCKCNPIALLLFLTLSL